MINIRKSVFETNSSSMHSLVFSKKDRGYSYDLPVDENGVLTITFGDYCWGPGILKTPLEKISYFITDQAPYIEDYNEMEWDEVIKIVLEESEKIRELLRIIKAKCPQVKEIKFQESQDFLGGLGSIDHQSCGTSNEIDSIEELIFNNNILILIDNDNSDIFDIRYRKDTDVEELFDLSLSELMSKRRIW